MKRIYRIEILSEIVVETKGLIKAEEILEEIRPLLHIKPSSSGRYQVINYQSDSNIYEVDDEMREIIEV